MFNIFDYIEQFEKELLMGSIDIMDKIAFVSFLLGLIAPYIDNRFNLFFWFYGNETYNDTVYTIFGISFMQYVIASFISSVVFFIVNFLSISYFFQNKIYNF